VDARRKHGLAHGPVSLRLIDGVPGKSAFMQLLLENISGFANLCQLHNVLGAQHIFQHHFPYNLFT